MTTDVLPQLSTSRGELPLRAYAVRATIAGTTAHVEVEQTFENVFDESLEVRYVFPLPDLAAVTRCELHLGERVVVAKLAERGAAHEMYETAIASGKRAALAEQERPGVFSTTLGNLQPGERARVVFAMAYLLPREHGRHVLRYPLVAGERYAAGAHDADRIAAPRLVPGAERPELSIDVTFESGELGIGDIECSMQITRAGDRVQLRPRQLLDRDFVLRFRIGDDAIRTQLAVDGETFQLTLVPPLAKLRTRPRDLVLLLDRSGSMDGWKIVAARRALARIVDALDDDDRFAVFAFGSQTVASPDFASDRLHAASAPNRADMGAWLAGMSAEGGTEMAQPLELATTLLGGDGERDRWIVLVTDGQVANEDELVALLARAPGARVLALGIDDAVNSSLLRRLATASGGRVELVQSAADLVDALDRLHLAIATPVIERITLDGGTGDGMPMIAAGSIVPAGPLSVFPGVPLVVRGRCRPSLERVTVSGRTGNEPFSQIVRAEPCANPALAACWAREKLVALEDALAASRGDQREAIGNELIATSLRFGVLCRFTAFIAVDDAGPLAQVATRSMQQPVEPTLAESSLASRPALAPTRWGGSGRMHRNSRTMAGVLKGKFGHMSPEMARGKPIEPPHEVFMLAVLLYELLANKRMFRADDDFSTLKLIVEPALPDPLVPANAAPLAPILRRALAREPAQRYPTAGAFADAVEAALAPASFAEVATWLAGVDPERLVEQDARLVRASAAHPPVRGYFLVERLEMTGTSMMYLASSPFGPVVFERLLDHIAEDPDGVDAFLGEAALSIPGITPILDCGVDQLGGVFRVMPFVAGLDLSTIQRSVTRATATIPPAIAVSIIVAAARALEAALHLGPKLGLVAHDIDPTELRVGVDGRPVWTTLGIAPHPSFTAARRTNVPLAHAPSIALGNPRTTHLPTPALVSPYVVVSSEPRDRPTTPPTKRRWWWR
jgi:Ca-activated chloride channel family protein